MNNSFIALTLGLSLTVSTSTAFAHSDHHVDGRLTGQEIAHERFHEGEERTQRLWAEQRAKRIEVVRDKMLGERREVLRKHGRGSPEWAHHIERWEKKWAEVRERERRLLIAERESIRRRHERYHQRTGYDLVRTDAADIERELDRCGLDRRAIFADDVVLRRPSLLKVHRPEFILRAAIAQ